MAYTLKTNTSNKNNYGSTRKITSINYIVIHYTSNDGDSDESNSNYFKRNIGASAHYFVDDDSITQSVPDNYVAWSVGGSKYNDCNITGGGKYYNKCINANSLSIELCDTNKNGVVYPTQATIDNAIEFCKFKMVQYGIDKSHVIRHFDVNGKHCPEYWCCNASKNELWKTEFWDKLSGWALYDSDWYWLDNNGNITKSQWVQSNGKWYYLSDCGKLITNQWIKNATGTWSYVNCNGEAVTGWSKLSWNGIENWYYFDENGNMLISTWINDNGKDYYLTSSGAMATNAYVQSKSQSIYYWVGDDGAWQQEWNTSYPDFSKYKVVV